MFSQCLWFFSTQNSKLVYKFESLSLNTRQGSLYRACPPMLDPYIGECMVSIININFSIKETTCGYQDYKLIKHCYLLSMSRLIVRLFCLTMKVLARYVDLNIIENKNIFKYSYPIGLEK